MELVQTLRRTEFPEDTRGALKHLERVCMAQSEANVAIPGLSEVQRADIPPEFLDELIFHQLDWQGNRRHLTAIQELQLLDILCTFFQDCKNPTLFRQIFFRLFPLDLSPMSYRTQVLCKSVSLSIAANSATFLTCVAEWLGRDLIANSQDGHHLPALSNALARPIVQDYCLLQSSTPKGVVGLASTSPEFACFFVRAIAQMFDMKGAPQYSFGSPPPSLLRVIADWLTENSALLRTPLTLPPNAPPHRKQALLTGPIFGLLRWCVKAPLIEVACSRLLKRIASEEAASNSATSSKKNASIIESATTQLTLTSVYSQLHLALLNCLMTQMEETGVTATTASSRVTGVHARSAMEPFTTQQFAELAQELVTLDADTRRDHRAVASLRSRSPDAMDAEDDDDAQSPETQTMTLCVDRLAQVIQVAKATNSLATQPGDLARIESILPSNSLLSVVVAHWDPPMRR